MTDTEPATTEPAGTEPAGAEPAGAEPARRRRVAPFVALAIALVLAALFVVLANSSSTRSDEVTSFAVGKPAPRVVTTTLDGAPFDLSRRKGSWVVLNFFASDCLPCKAEHPELVRFVDQQRALGSNGAEFYTVIKDDSDANVRKWFAVNGGEWPVLHDANGTISVALGVAQVPETWIIDPQGVIVDRIATTVTADGLSQLIQRYRDAGT